MIPSKFSILSHEVEVVIDNEYCHANNCMGRFIYYDNKIIIADKYKTDKTWRKYKESIIEHNFYHELTHCILYYTGNKKLWLNERLVDSIGGMWLQYDKSKT
jgi:hypothetical protein